MLIRLAPLSLDEFTFHRGILDRHELKKGGKEKKDQTKKRKTRPDQTGFVHLYKVKRKSDLAGKIFASFFYEYLMSDRKSVV